MKSDYSHSQMNDLQVRLRLIHTLESGQFESIQCPTCDNPSISAWFTHPVETEYRTWFVCNNCSFRLRVQNSGKPQHFSTERLNTELESYDSELISKRKL